MPAPEPGLTYNGLTIPETIPNDVSFLDAYQDNTWSQIKYDENGHTIKGKPILTYMADGIIEETFELIEPDKVEPDYLRPGALFHDPGFDYSVKPGVVTATALERHAKEFGDVSWYLSNMMRLLNKRLSDVLKVGLIARELDIASAPRASEDFVLETERTIPGFFLLGSSAALSTAAKELRDNRGRDGRTIREREVIIASGKFMISAFHVASARFGTTYEAFLNQNKKKLDKRIADGTVFDKSGGDDR